jgi:hypothetical protein
MGGSKKGKASKNNVENRAKVKQARVISSTECQKCNDQCDAYFKYEKSLSEGKIGKGVCCRKGL